jgi:hypothetical protein
LSPERLHERIRERKQSHESQRISETTLPQMQDHQAAGRGDGNLQQSETQAAPGVNTLPVRAAGENWLVSSLSGVE